MLESAVFTKISMADSILLVFLHNSLTVVWFIVSGCIYDESNLVLNLEQKIITIGFLLDILNRMANQFHQVIVIGELSLAVCDIASKRCVFCDMPCNVDGAFYVAVVVEIPNILFEEALSHCRFQTVWEQEQQQVEKPVVLIGIGLQINYIGNVQDPVKKVLEKEVLSLMAEP